MRVKVGLIQFLSLRLAPTLFWNASQPTNWRLCLKCERNKGRRRKSALLRFWTELLFLNVISSRYNYNYFSNFLNYPVFLICFRRPLLARPRRRVRPRHICTNIACTYNLLNKWSFSHSSSSCFCSLPCSSLLPETQEIINQSLLCTYWFMERMLRPHELPCRTRKGRFRKVIDRDVGTTEAVVNVERGRATIGTDIYVQINLNETGRTLPNIRERLSIRPPWPFAGFAVQRRIWPPHLATFDGQNQKRNTAEQSERVILVSDRVRDVIKRLLWNNLLRARSVTP